MNIPTYWTPTGANIEGERDSTSYQMVQFPLQKCVYYITLLMHIFICNLCRIYLVLTYIKPSSQAEHHAVYCFRIIFSSINNDTFARGAGAGRSTLRTATSRKLQRCQRTRNVTLWGPASKNVHSCHWTYGQWH